MFVVSFVVAPSASAQSAAQAAAAEAASQAAYEAQMAREEQMALESMEQYGNEGGYDEYGGGSAYAPGREGPGTPSQMEFWHLFGPRFSDVRRTVFNLTQQQRSEPIASGPVLRNESHVAFRYGNLPLALELFHGHLARANEAAKPALQAIRFDPIRRQPTWLQRWGISIAIRGDTDVADPNPIKADAQANRGRGMDEFDGGFGSDEAAFEARGGVGGGDRGPRNFARERFADESFMRQRIEEERFAMSGGEGMDPDGMDQRGFDRRGGDRFSDTDFAAEPEMLDEDASSQLSSTLGLVAESIRSNWSTRLKRQQFGSGLTDVAETSSTQGSTVGDESVSPSSPSMWIPAMLFIGEGSSRETTSLAADAGVELLLHFDVNLKELREGVVQNISRVRLIDVATGKTIVTSGAMDNAEVDRLERTSRGTAQEHVDDQTEAFWKIIDSRVATRELPTISSDAARRRITQLLGDPRLPVLRQLAEVRYFAEAGLIDSEELEQAFAIAGGTKAMAILYGSDQQAFEAVRELAWESQSSDDQT
ncbi:MAG: hypothetical protein AAF539_12585 [Planctomycetota bacterium]